MTTRPRRSEKRHWWLLIHQLPPDPPYLRVKIGRRLSRLGAVALKNSVYVLPRSEAALEDFQWLLQEIRADGGEAFICDASFADDRTDADILRTMRAARDEEYGEVERAAKAGSKSLNGQQRAEAARLRARLAEVARVDFGDAPRRKSAEKAVAALEAQARSPEQKASPGRRERLIARTWVTRAGIKVDRMASAWLIRRFIDKKAKFRFIDEKTYTHRAGELRFDMLGAEYTHEGDRCSFETLLHRFGLEDRGLRHLAELIHDLDVKDGKYDRKEAPGVGLVLDAIVHSNARDADRLARATHFFDELYASLT